MQNTDAFERDWRDRGLGRPLHREMTFTQAGLVLGRGTLLAEFGKEGLAARGLAFDGEEARALSLLTAAYAAPVAPHVIAKIRRAGEYWRAGEKALAQIRLALIGLPKIDGADAFRLFLAGTAFEKGVGPSDLMKALGFPRAARDIEKYSPDQPRVPAGSGRESGQWTSGEASGSGTGAESRVPRNAHVKPFVPHVVGGVVSDANPDGIVTGAQYARASPTPVLTAERINHILEMHGPGAKDRKGEFYPAFANGEFIKWLVEGAWEKAIPTHVYAGQEIDRVVIGARAYVEDDTGKHPLNIERSGRGLKTPSIETDNYIVILDSNNNVITCYPINPADVVYPYDED